MVLILIIVAGVWLGVAMWRRSPIRAWMSNNIAEDRERRSKAGKLRWSERQQDSREDRKEKLAEYRAMRAKLDAEAAKKNS
jgi:hypothetical protein